MATVRPVLWKHKKNKQGHHPLWLRFDDGSRTLYHSLRVSLHPRHWNPRTERVRKSHDLHEDLNNLIEARLAEAETERIRLLTHGEAPTAEGLKLAIVGKGRTDCFLAYARDGLEAVRQQGNVQRDRKERAVLAKLEAFGGSPLPFGRLTTAFLDRWTAWMLTERGNKASTVKSAMGIVRSHYNRAIRHGVVRASDSPFPNYKLPRIAKPERDRLTETEVTTLEALDLGPRGPAGSGLAKVRDWFLFALFAQGMRFSDVVQLRRSDVVQSDDDGGAYRLRYRMGKTGKTTTVLLVPRAVAVLAPYLDRPSAGYLFDALDRYDTSTPKGLNKALSSRNAYANKVLGQLAERAEIQKHLTMHVARHSFADLARKGGWSTYDVSRALQHSSLAITDRYLASLDPQTMDTQMRRLFDQP